MTQHFRTAIPVMMMALTALPALSGSKETLASVAGIATFTSDGVNLRKGPSTSDPYLVYLQGEELYMDADNIIWSDEMGGMRIGGKLVQPDHWKMQGNSGESYAVIGSEGDWVKLNYLGHDVWTMKKFVDINPLTPLSTSMTYALGNYNTLNVTGTEEGAPALYYQEAGMDEDQCFYIGHVEGNAIVFDHILPFELVDVPGLEDAMLTKSQQGDWMTLRIGPGQMVRNFPAPDVKTFKPQRIKDMTRAADKLPEDGLLIMVNTPRGVMAF